MIINSFKLKDYDLYIECFDSRIIRLFKPCEDVILHKFELYLLDKGYLVNTWDFEVNVGLGWFNFDNFIGMVEVLTNGFPNFNFFKLKPINIIECLNDIELFFINNHLINIEVEDKIYKVDIGLSLSELNTMREDIEKLKTNKLK